MTASPLVSGTIVFEPSQPDLTGAKVTVRLEDISIADASAQTVSRQVLLDPAEAATADGVPFQLPGSRGDIKPQRQYSVAVHVDMDRSGSVTRGDYVSTATHPVLTNGHPDQVTVDVAKV